MPRLLTVSEAAEALTRITGKPTNAQRVYYLIRMSRLAALRVGNHIRIWLNLPRLLAA
jgi:hypothetical protein